MKHLVFPRAGFLQFAIRFGDPRENLETVQKLVDGLQPEQDTLIVLPELWASGFDYANARDHARRTPDILGEIGEIAAGKKIYIAGSLLEEERSNPGSLYNSLYVSGPDGVAGKFQKQHLFSFWHEDRHFQPGNFCQPVRTHWGQIGGLVCYDLRFPEISRDLAFRGANTILVSAQWPAERIDHWRILLRARAVENQVFVIASNGCGTTGAVAMGGHSMVVGPDGTILVEAGTGQEAQIPVLPDNILPGIREKFCTAGERPRPVRDGKKILDIDRLKPLLATLRGQGSRIAFTNGCFDILHSGHVAYLEKARRSADCLVVGLNTDASVRKIKGPGRPINSETERARVLSALDCVDFVVLFAEETPLSLIRTIMPDVLVKGADWPEERIIGANEVKSAGGRILRIDFEHAVSTSQVIERVQRNLPGENGNDL